MNYINSFQKYNVDATGMEVRPCGNSKAMADLATGLEIDCGNGPHRQDCPVGSYCHITLTAARCCPKSEYKILHYVLVILHSA